jgi:hypothetical protein
MMEEIRKNIYTELKNSAKLDTHMQVDGLKEKVKHKE